MRVACNTSVPMHLAGLMDSRFSFLSLCCRTLYRMVKALLYSNAGKVIEEGPALYGVHLSLVGDE